MFKKKKMVRNILLSMSLVIFYLIPSLSFADVGGAINQESNITFYEETNVTSDSKPIVNSKLDHSSKTGESNSILEKILPQTGEKTIKLYIIIGCVLLMITVCGLEMMWRRNDV